MSTPVTFRSAAAFRAWLARHHRTARELTVRLFKVHAADRGLTYTQAVDEALCYGWIDGVKRAYDADSFTHRFTPRRRGSIWSRVNIAKAERLIAEGRMCPAGRAAFDARTPDRSGVYSFERGDVALAPALLRIFRRDRAAWAYYSTRPPGYRKLTAHWIMSAKQDETRARRLKILMTCSARGEPIPALKRNR